MQEMPDGKQPAGDPEFCQIPGTLTCCKGAEKGP